MTNIRVHQLAKELNLSTAELIKELKQLGIEVKSHSSSLDELTAELVKEEITKKQAKPALEPEPVRKGKPAKIKPVEPKEKLESLPRAPVVTVMGHIDHGKTTLLDAIRKTNVTEKEVGGITQHIGASQVEVKGKKIVFIDTPGHEAFTAIRARGAQVTDIVVLVVAADEGVMPQTVEAIHHARAAGVPILVAINKIDKPEANIDKTKQQLAEHGLIPEEWGGQTVFVPISAKNGTGLEDLLEMILLMAEMAELRADPKGKLKATVIETKLDRTKGPLATVLVQNGTLKVGDIVTAGAAYGKIRAMVDDKNRKLNEAGPSTPVEILGLSSVPQAGDPLEVFSDEREAREMAALREEQLRQEKLSRPPITLEYLYKKIQEDKIKDLNLIVKADAQGSVDALRQSLESLHMDEVRINIIHSAVGNVTESDVMLASASQAIIIGFNVRAETSAEKAAKEEKIDLRFYQVIYDVLDDVKAALLGMLEPVYEEQRLGLAEVRALFRLSKGQVAAGCYVTSGTLRRDANLRVLRDEKVVFEGKLTSLKRFKDDVREVGTGFECGVAVDGFNDFREGDLLEAYQLREVRRERISSQ